MNSINKLFKAAGFQYENMEEMKRYDISNKNLEVKSYDKKLKKQVWKRVNALFYKGMSDINNSFEININGDKSFLCTGKHLLLVNNEFVPVEKLPSGLTEAIDITGNNILIYIAPKAISFPILDMEVEDTECYISAGIGGGAKVFSEGLRKFNPILSKYKTSLIMISQERDNVGCIAANTELTWKKLSDE